MTVPHTTLLGVDDKPGQLFGVDSLPAQVCRELAADSKSTWRRLLADPVSGMVTDVGRKRYPPATMVESVRLWHPRCTHTCVCNLNPRCERHNLCKERPGLHVEQPEPDLVITTSPLGSTVAVRAEPIAVDSPKRHTHTPDTRSVAS
ncbi:hypothetical protein [Herbihabitans rhizosphaerae]|uniref:hypothetical protein n=1 Tax=Herbihabitans rhizosphaerae TaxID=1872711 RepID=UPI00102C145E|nr:hypothetical protein [Herbihabitans rhizosphaerae]